MPFETGLPVRRKIAVIGGGISGMGAAYELGETHDVTLIEAEPRLGGHARTVVAGKHGNQPVDTGFIVFNYANYPNLARIFDELAVPVVKSDMSFGASVRGGGLEYGLASFDAVFAQRRNIVNPRFIGMLRDIFRFNAQAPAKAASHKDHSIGDFLDELGTGNWFRDYYLMPLSGAIWSTPKDRVMDFPAQALIQFFENHALMNYAGQHQWYTVAGGSISYVERLERAMRAQGVQMRLGCPVDAVRRTDSGPEVKMHGGEWDTFDEVIFATHSDDTLRLLSDPTEAENATLGVIGYQPNDVVLHADPNVMPRKRAVWSSWNYSEAPARRDGQIDITYWMNRLQPIPQEDPHFVTLNSTRPIRDELIYDQVTLRHPVYDLAALRAQGQVRAMNGANNTWFCGAWMRNGFHEDGLSSGIDVAEAINARALSAQVAAE